MSKVYSLVSHGTEVVNVTMQITVADPEGANPLSAPCF